jgi:hypothetical protein
MNDHNELLERFIASFAVVAETLDADEILDPIAWRLATGPADEYGYKRWSPIKVQTDAYALEPLYTKLPARFPPLYEQLLLSYRWAEVDLQSFTLLANSPGEGLSGLLQHIMKDKGLWETLIPNGYIQFGKGPDVDYDPVCFDISSRNNRDYRIVKIDHEEILCNYRIKVVSEIAPSFRALVLQTIEYAETIRASESQKL